MKNGTDRVELLAALAAVAIATGGAIGSGATGTSAPEGSLERRGAASEVSFAKDVVPILEKRCVQCHGGVDENGEERVELSFNMTTYEGLMMGSEYGTVIEPGNPDESLLIEMIEEGDMPEEGDPVPPEELEVLKAWIAEGAKEN